MKALFLLLSLTFALSAQADQQVESLTCGDFSGLCFKMDDMMYNYNWQCQGNACYSIWNQRVTELQGLSDAIDNSNISYVDQDLYGKAYRLSSMICTSAAHNVEQGLLIQMISAENALLHRLADIQRNSADGNQVYTCTRTIR